MSLVGLEQVETVLRVQGVRCLEGFRVELSLTDGSRRGIDLEPYLVGPIFAPLREDEDVFRQVRVDEELRTLVWPSGADICPDVLVHGRTPAALERGAESGAARLPITQQSLA